MQRFRGSLPQMQITNRTHADTQVHVAFKPVALMLLAIMGISFGLAVAGLAGYHWFLVL